IKGKVGEVLGVVFEEFFSLIVFSVGFIENILGGNLDELVAFQIGAFDPVKKDLMAVAFQDTGKLNHFLGISTGRILSMRGEMGQAQKMEAEFFHFSHSFRRKIK